MSGAGSHPNSYCVPLGDLSLAGPVERPAPGRLPLRGDLAHIALAGTHLAAHYAIPFARRVGAGGAVLRLQPRAEAEEVTRLAPDSGFELLDMTGEWVWGCVGPEGPAGWCHSSELAADEEA